MEFKNIYTWFEHIVGIISIIIFIPLLIFLLLGYIYSFGLLTVMAGVIIWGLEMYLSFRFIDPWLVKKALNNPAFQNLNDLGFEYKELQFRLPDPPEKVFVGVYKGFEVFVMADTFKIMASWFPKFSKVTYTISTTYRYTPTHIDRRLCYKKLPVTTWLNDSSSFTRLTLNYKRDADNFLVDAVKDLIDFLIEANYQPPIRFIPLESLDGNFVDKSWI